MEQYFPGGDWSVNYTEKLLGIDLCVKKLPGGDHTDHPVMPDFAGLTVLVDALDEKLAAWKEIFGAKKIKSRIEKMTVNYLGADCEVTVKAAEISDGLLPVDLIEAGKNGPFADYFRAHGSGVFQISIPSSDDYRKKTAAALEAEGMDELLRYELFGKRYTVYNTVDRMGANIALA